MAEVVNPVKLNDETVKTIENALALDCSIEEVCLMANITRQTYYNWINSFPELRERFDILRAAPFLKARKTINDSLSNPQYAFEYMKRKKKNEFSERSEVTGADGKELQPVLVKFITDEGSRNTHSDRV
jgi:predicted DNA-binding protein YlxM (UPF0122 family)